MPTLQPAMTRPPLTSATTSSVDLQGPSGAPISVTWDTPFGHAVTQAAHDSSGFYNFALAEKGLTTPTQVLTFDQAQQRFDLLNNKIVKPVTPKIMDPVGAFFEHVVLSIASWAATYAAAGAGALLTWSAMTLLGHSFTQWPAIDATAKILATVMASVIPSLVIKPSGIFMDNTLDTEYVAKIDTTSHALIRHFINLVSFSLFTYVFFVSSDINPCDIDHPFTSVIDWIHNRHIFVDDPVGPHDSKFFPALAFAYGGAALAAAISPLLVKVVDGAKHISGTSKRRRARSNEMQLLQNILALRDNRELIRKYFPHHVEEMEKLIDDHLTPVFEAQIQKLTAKKEEFEALIKNLEKTRDEGLNDISGTVKENLIADLDLKIVTLKAKITKLQEQSIDAFNHDVETAAAIKEQMRKFFSIQESVDAIEATNQQLAAADTAAIEIDFLIKETDRMRQDMAQQLFRMVQDADMAYRAASEIAHTEALGMPAPPV